MTELKMCPFCGEQIYYEVPKGSMDFDGHCWNKNCFMYGIEITFGDIAKYNTRPIEDELEARIAQLTAERDEWKNKFADALACNGRLVEQVEQLTAERDELKLAVAQTKLDISAWKNICTEWYKDAERLAKTFVIEVYPHEWVCRSGCHHMGKSPATINHAPDCPITLHRELVEKYKETK